MFISFRRLSILPSVFQRLFRILILSAFNPVIILFLGTVVTAQDRVVQTDIYDVGGSKEPDTREPSAVKERSGKTDTFGIQETRGGDGKVSTSGERKEGSPFYTNGASKTGGAPASAVPEKPREDGPLYTKGNGKKSVDSPGTEEQQIKQEGRADTYGGKGVKNGDKHGSEMIKKPSEGGTDAYGIREMRGADSRDAAPIKKNVDGDLFGATQLKKSSADGITMINHPPNIQGLTGLLVTNSAFSRPADTVSMGASVMMEASKRPEFDITQIPVTITYGLTNEAELGIKVKMVSIDDKSGNVAEKHSGIGDTEILIKGRIIEQQENLPAVAVAVGGILPTGKKSEGINEVTHWGAKIIMLASSEAPILKDQFLGIYLEAQLVFIDAFTKGSGNTPTAEQYGVFNLGVLTPLAFDNRLQAIIEYNRLIDKNRNTLNEQDYNVLTPALRFVTANLSVTFGAQLMNKSTAGHEDTVRYISTVSYTF